MYRERLVRLLRPMHDGKVVVVVGDVYDDVGDTEWRAGVEPRMVGSARYEPINHPGVTAKGDATEKLTSVRGDVERLTVVCVW